MEAEPPAEGPPPPPVEAAPEPIKKKKVIKKDVSVAAASVSGYSQQQLNDYFEAEGRMQSADKLQEDTNEAKNALEAYIYSLRGKLYEGLAPFVKEVRGHTRLDRPQNMCQNLPYAHSAAITCMGTTSIDISAMALCDERVCFHDEYTQLVLH
jgi:hypothetical protein